MQMSVGSLLCSCLCCGAQGSLLSRQKLCGNRFGEVAEEIKMLVTTEVVIITASDLVQDRKKPLILALHDKYNIIRTYYNPVLLEIQVVWTGVHFLYASEYS